MRRVLLTTISLLAFTATAAVAADLPRQMPAKAPAYRAGRLQLDRLLSRHQRRLRLGPLALERLRQQRRSIGRHGRRHRRLQLAGHGQPVGVRPRRRHRLDQHQGTFTNITCPTGCQTKNNWLGTVRGRVGYAWDRVMPYITGGLAVGDIEANPARLRRRARHQCRLDSRRRHRSGAGRQLDRQARISPRRSRQRQLRRAVLRVPTNVGLPCRRSPRRRELPVLTDHAKRDTQRPRTMLRGLCALLELRTIFV